MIGGRTSEGDWWTATGYSDGEAGYRLLTIPSGARAPDAVPSTKGMVRELGLLLLPLPYHTANGKTVPAVIIILRVDIRRVRTQDVTVGSRTSSSRPPEATCDASVDVAIRASVVARTEKVELFSCNFRNFSIKCLDIFDNLCYNGDIGYHYKCLVLQFKVTQAIFHPQCPVFGWIFRVKYQ